MFVHAIFTFDDAEEAVFGKNQHEVKEKYISQDFIFIAVDD